MLTETENSPSSLGGLRILLVEDEAMVAMLMEGMLDGLGCQRVEWVTSVSAALQALERGEYDGALLDVNLSGAAVYPVAEALASRKLPFVFVSGYGRTAEVHPRFPHAAVLKKPFDSGDLASIIKKEIASARGRC
jgi:CheY-like chemotaxis protein